jgi:hypothetical protein
MVGSIKIYDNRKRAKGVDEKESIERAVMKCLENEDVKAKIIQIISSHRQQSAF